MSSRRIQSSVARVSVSISTFRRTVTFRNFMDTAENIVTGVQAVAADLGLQVASATRTPKARKVIVTIHQPFELRAMANAVREEFALYDYAVVHVPGTAVLTFQDRTATRKLVFPPTGFVRARSPVSARRRQVSRR